MPNIHCTWDMLDVSKLSLIHPDEIGKASGVLEWRLTEHTSADNLKLHFPAAFAASTLAWGFLEFQQVLSSASGCLSLRSQLKAVSIPDNNSHASHLCVFDKGAVLS